MFKNCEELCKKIILGPASEAMCVDLALQSFQIVVFDLNSDTFKNNS
jgi:hypothetical protein